MIFYFSGIGDRKNFELLDGVVSDFLVDEIDIAHLPADRRVGILDSGAYRLYKKGLTINLDGYVAQTRRLAARCDRCRCSLPGRCVVGGSRAAARRRRDRADAAERHRGE